MILVGTAAIAADKRRTAPGLAGLGPVVHEFLAYVLILPWVGWFLLRVVGVRPAWAVALVGQVLLIPVAGILDAPGDPSVPPWRYGLEAALSYGVAALLCLPLAVTLCATRTKSRDGEPATPSGSRSDTDRA